MCACLLARAAGMDVQQGIELSKPTEGHDGLQSSQMHSFAAQA